MNAKTVAAATCCALLTACAAIRGSEAPKNAFEIHAPGMSDDAMMSKKNGGNFTKIKNCLGENVSPPLAWSNAPAKTKSYALIVDDQAGRDGLGVSHAVLYGIPASVSSFPEGALGGPANGKFVPGKDSVGVPYLGPCPPHGLSPHHYVFTFLATDLEPGELRPGLTRAELLHELRHHALGAASLVLRFAQ